ncbi:7-cyano-7-deazaguanine synthase [Thiohalorhabdus sp.]|uniref:7-cyano-7-deazaguanine synthase n=1 Tax=Thiohalorhabdus sp. TaxID=3094134 RepID=UPI002FC307B2
MTADNSRLTLVLASGGVETATLLHQAAAAGDRVRAAFVDYGQRPAGMERRGAVAQSLAAGATLETLDMAAIGRAFQGDSERQYHVPLPHRNLVVLSLGLSLADKRAVDRLWVGSTADDGSASRSASASFFQQFRDLAANLGTVTVEAPLLEQTKSQVIRHGWELGVAFANTYSCLLGYARPCGQCPQCRKRAAAFAAAGLADHPCRLAKGDP